METKDYTQEIIDIIRSNTSPAVMSSRLEDYHANDLAEVLKKLTVQERCKLYRILDKDMLSDILEYFSALNIRWVLVTHMHQIQKYILNQSASYDTHIPSCLYIDNSWLSVLKKSVFLSDKAVVAGSFLILHYFAMANIKVSPQIA